jgi:hypothetical protein
MKGSEGFACDPVGSMGNDAIPEIAFLRHCLPGADRFPYFL